MTDEELAPKYRASPTSLPRLLDSVIGHAWDVIIRNKPIDLYLLARTVTQIMFSFGSILFCVYVIEDRFALGRYSHSVSNHGTISGMEMAGSQEGTVIQKYTRSTQSTRTTCSSSEELPETLTTPKVTEQVTDDSEGRTAELNVSLFKNNQAVEPQTNRRRRGDFLPVAMEESPTGGSDENDSPHKDCAHHGLLLFTALTQVMPD